jgi:hypothetical protein
VASHLVASRVVLSSIELVSSGILSQRDANKAHAAKQNQTPWSESASQLYRPSDRRLSAKLVPTFVERGCHMVSVMDPYGCIIDFLDWNRYFFFQVAQLYSRG